MNTEVSVAMPVRSLKYAFAVILVAIFIIILQYVTYNIPHLFSVALHSSVVLLEIHAMILF
jgi:hypothetical protein